MNTETILRKAKAKLSNPDKWMKDGEYVADDGCMCAMGAVYQSLDPDAKSYSELSAEKETLAANIEDQLDEIVTEYTDHNFRCIIRFNDQPDTTHEDLMNIFDKAIEKAEQE